MARVTIRHVAVEAGVSVATVSKVINDRYGVAADTRRRVLEVVERLGYESSLAARGLRSRSGHRTNVLGILVADIEPFSAELLKGAAAAVRGTDRQLIVYSGSGHGTEHSGWERRNVARLGTLADGLVLVTPTVAVLDDLMPIVVADPHAGPSELPTVGSDNLAGAVTATRHLIDLGHRRIGFLAGRPDLESARLREDGYRRALADAGIAFDPALVRVGGYEPELSEEPARALLKLPERPSAIFAANDLSAITTMEVARSLGLSVPDDVSVIGFDNIPESALAETPLTTIDQSIQAMGREAIELLIDVIDGGTGRPRHVTLPTRLVIRQSCGPAPR